MGTSGFTRRHVGCVILGGLLIAIGVFLPRDWYDALPTNPEIPPPPLKGVSLLQWVMVLEGVVLIGLGLRRWAYVRLDPAERVHVRTPPDPGAAISARTSLLLLGGITLLALVLRCLELDSDFWIDEIRATLDALLDLGTPVQVSHEKLTRAIGFAPTDMASAVPQIEDFPRKRQGSEA